MESTNTKNLWGMKIALLFVAAGICVVSAGWVLAQTAVMEVKEDLKVDTDTLYIDSANNRVGIGTTGPSSALDVVGSVEVSDDLTVTDDVTISGQLTVDSSTLHVDSGADHVGIGTNSPDYKLEVEEPSNTHLYLAITNSYETNRVAGIRIKTNDCAWYIRHTGTYQSPGTYPANSLEVLGPAGTTMLMDGDGKVGIGTKSPGNYGNAADNLVIYAATGGAGLTIATNSNNAGSIYFADGTSGNDYRMASIAYDHSDEKLYFRTTPDGGSPTNRITVTDNGYVGIGASSPTEKLDVNGAIRLRAMANPPSGTGNPTFYVDEISSLERMCVRDGSGNDTVLSSHRDPREVDPEAASSFADANIPLPFSFSHSNAFIGKGAVVDMAALVAKVEQLTGEIFTHEYALPVEEVFSLAEWQQQRLAQLEKEAKEKILEQQPEIEIPISEAWEEVEIQQEIQTVQTDVRWSYNLETEELFTTPVEETVTEVVGTGQYEKRLKSGVRFDDKAGKFYRRRTLDEVDIDPIPAPTLPDWITNRLP